jgi:hypothetical protein
MQTAQRAFSARNIYDMDRTGIAVLLFEIFEFLWFIQIQLDVQYYLFLKSF